MPNTPVSKQAKNPAQDRLSPVSQRFIETVYMYPRPGLYFHNPEGYPESRWKRLCWMPVDAAWEWLLRVAPEQKFNHSGVFKNQPAPSFGELRGRNPGALWPQSVAFVVSVTENEILAVFHDPDPPADAPFPYCLIAIHP